jgi:hypothetical protein
MFQEFSGQHRALLVLPWTGAASIFLAFPENVQLLDCCWQLILNPLWYHTGVPCSRCHKLVECERGSEQVVFVKAGVIGAAPIAAILGLLTPFGECVEGRWRPLFPCRAAYWRRSTWRQ